MTIYIDDDYKCYVSAADGRRAVETDFFNGKCDEWIESYRLVPSGETWTRGDGELIRGEMAAPWKDYNELVMAQLGYMTEKMAETPSTDEIMTAIEEGVNSI